MFKFIKKVFKKDDIKITIYAEYNFTKKTVKSLVNNLSLHGICEDTRFMCIFCPVEVLNNKRLSPDPVLNLKPGWSLI